MTDSETFPTEQPRIVRAAVPPESEGMRLDLFLAKRFTYQSRTGWQDLIEQGRLLVGGRMVRSSRKLHAGETVEFMTDGIAEPEVDTSYRILLETPEFIAVDKPACLPVHPSGCYFHNTLLMLMQERYGRPYYPINRLDRETSGVVLFAKSSAAAKALTALFSTHAIRKTYYAAVFGEFPSGHQMRNGFLIADDHSEVRKKRRYTEDAVTASNYQDAESCSTEFELVEQNNGISLVKCFPNTGRLHQIRATLYSCGFPMVGDKLYGPDDRIYLRFIDDTITEDDYALLILKRQALHACSLAFQSPFDGQNFFVECPLPEEILSLTNSETNVY